MDEPRKRFAAMISGLDIRYDLGGEPATRVRVPNIEPDHGSTRPGRVSPASARMPAGAAQPRRTWRLRHHSLGGPGPADRRHMRWRLGASGTRRGPCSHRRADPARWICRLGGRPDPPGASCRVTTSSATPRPHSAKDSLAAQSRKAASYAVSPFHCRDIVERCRRTQFHLGEVTGLSGRPHPAPITRPWCAGSRRRPAQESTGHGRTSAPHRDQLPFHGRGHRRARAWWSAAHGGGRAGGRRHAAG